MPPDAATVPSDAPTVARGECEPPLILSLDIGTSAIRAILYDGRGRAVQGVDARHPLDIEAHPDGAVITDPDELLAAVGRCVDDALALAGSLAGQIQAVGKCTFVGNVMGVDKAGRPVTPLMTYADTRPADDVAGLRRDFDEAAAHDRTGCRFHPAYLPARFRWLARTQPETWRRAAHWLSLDEYLQRHLFGHAAVSYSVAAWTGLLDRRRLVWDETLLAGLPVAAAQLSPLTDVHVPQRGLCAPYADRWPALRDVVWFPAVGDGAAANVGSGCVSPRRMALTVGTTSAVRAVIAGNVEDVPLGLWCYRVDGRRSLPGGALSEGGSVFAWMRDTLQLGDLAALEATLSGMEPDGHGLTVLPFLAGERSPGYAGHARATLHGLSLATRPVDILRAGLEAVAYRVALVVELMAHIVPDNAEVVASGGALLGSPTWLQMMTDVLNRPVRVSNVKEASSRGVALLALEALGALRDVADAPDLLGATYWPDAARHARYAAGMARHRALYRTLVENTV